MSLNDLTAEDLVFLDSPTFETNEKVTFGINNLTVQQKLSKSNEPFKILKLDTKVVSGKNIGKPYSLVLTSYSKKKYVQLLAAIYGIQKVKSNAMQEAEAVGKKIYAYYGGKSKANDRGQTFDEWESFIPFAEETSKQQAF